MTEQIALDTNVLIYLHEPTDTDKRKNALELMASVPVISSQTVSEYLNVLRRILKTPKQVLFAEAISWLEIGEILPVSFSTLETAQALMKKYDFQLFDSIIVAGALQSNCTILYSEDMHHDLLVENKLRIVNPFR
jgi:predicted nucleic acid-binding protein